MWDFIQNTAENLDKAGESLQTGFKNAVDTAVKTVDETTTKVAEDTETLKKNTAENIPMFILTPSYNG